MSGSHIPAALRRLVYERANGCCEYCLLPEAVSLASHEVDHIIAEKHGGSTDADNLALSCTLCNKRKGSDLSSIDPVTGNIVPLYNPRRDHWADHFQLDGAQFAARTPTGRTTLHFLHLNASERVYERELLLAAGLFKLSGADD